MMGRHAPESYRTTNRGQPPTPENPLGGSGNFFWGVKCFEEEEAWKRCGVAGADEDWVRPLDAEDEEKGLLWVVSDNVEGLDCAPLYKDTSLAACRAAPRVAGANKSSCWKIGSDNRLRFWTSVTEGTMWLRKDSPLLVATKATAPGESGLSRQKSGIKPSSSSTGKCRTPRHSARFSPAPQHLSPTSGQIWYPMVWSSLSRIVGRWLWVPIPGKANETPSWPLRLRA